MSSFIQNALILLGLIGIAGLGFYLYTENARSGLDTQRAGVSNQVAAEASEFLRRLNELKAVSLDIAVLQDARFSSLVNFSAPLQIEPIGDSNPFGDN